MDLLTIGRTVLRRWVVVVPVLLLTALGAFLLHSRTDAQYEAKGSLLITQSALTSTQDDENATRYSENPGSANLTGAVLAEIVQGDPVRSQLQERDGTATYSVQYDTAESILRVTANSADQDSAIETVQLVIAALEEEVDRRQAEAEVPPEARVRTDVLTTPMSAQPETVDTGGGTTGTRFTASGSVRLLNTPEAAANPYAASPEGAFRVIQELAGSPQGRQSVAAAGGLADYTVEMLPRDTAPVAYVTATGTDRDNVLATYRAVVSFLEDSIAERQEAAGAPPATWLTLEPLSTPEDVLRTSGSLSRPLVALVGMGVVLAVTLAVVLDGFLADRVRRRTRTSDLRQSLSVHPLLEDGPPQATDRDLAGWRS